MIAEVNLKLDSFAHFLFGFRVLLFCTYTFEIDSEIERDLKKNLQPKYKSKKRPRFEIFSYPVKKKKKKYHLKIYNWKRMLSYR